MLFSRRHVRWAVPAVALLSLTAVSRHWITKAEPAARAGATDIPFAVVKRGDVTATIRVSGALAALHSVNLLAPRILGSRSGFNRGGDTNFGGPGAGGAGGGGAAGGFDFSLVLLTLAKPGTRVKAGDVIAQFDPQSQMQRLDDYRDTVVQLENSVKSSKAALAALLETHAQQVRSAKADQEKAALDLKTTPVLTEIDRERLKLSLEEAEATYAELTHETSLIEESQRAQLHMMELNLEQSRIEEKRAESNVEKMTIRAPIDGFIVAASIVRNGEFGQVREGDQVNAGQPFVSVVDPASMVLNGSINQVDAGVLRLGMKAAVHVDAYPAVELPGVVQGIGAMSVTSAFRASYVAELPIRVQIDASDTRLLPDLTGSAEVTLQSVPNVVVVPQAAVLQEEGASFVYVRREEGWVKRPVELGLESRTASAVRSGLEAGDVVALRPPGT